MHFCLWELYILAQTHQGKRNGIFPLFYNVAYTCTGDRIEHAVLKLIICRCKYM
jgi:hypothetical protein